MNIRLIGVLVAAILLAHAVLIHLLLRTDSMAAASAGKRAEAERAEKGNDDDFLSGETSEEKTKSDADPSGRNAISSESSDPTSIRPGIPAVNKIAPGKKLSLDYSRAVRGKIPKVAGLVDTASGILVDLNTNRVLWEKNSTQSYPIASMSKLMTMLIAAEKAQDGTLPDGFDTKIPVTREAAQVPPSRVYLMVGETFTLRELLTASAVKSANDAAWLIGQYIGGGKIDTFISMMNKRAAELGMKNTVFFNPHGLPGSVKAKDNRSSAADMVLLCSEFMRHKELCELTSLRSVDFRQPGQKGYIKLYNHNNLLPGSKFGTTGVTGLKTGFTNRAGFCLAVTCTRSGRNLLAIVTGFPDVKGRDTFARNLLEWGYKQKP